jgi:hypothetical protein
MDRKLRYVYALGPYGADVINSNGAQNLAQVRLHGIPAFPRPFTKDSTGCKRKDCLLTVQK